MPTFSTLPVSMCLRSLMNVSVVARDLVDRAVEPQRGIDAVGQEIAGHAAAGDLGIQPPQPAPPCGRSLEMVQSCRNLAR